MNYSNSIDQYSTELISLIKELDRDVISKIIDCLENVKKRNKSIFLAGNGGSASTVNHFVTDLGVDFNNQQFESFKAYSLSNQTSIITKYGNDSSFDQIFCKQLTSLASEGDLLIVLSTSGRSKNIIKAVDIAHKLKMEIICLIGNNSKLVRKKSNIVLNVNSEDKTQVENLHLIVLHMITHILKNVN